MTEFEKFYNADKSIYQPLLKIVTNGNYSPNKNGIVRVIFYLKNRFCVLVGDKDSFIVKGLQKRDLEGMLNLLQRFSRLSYSLTLSGEAFIIKMEIPLKAKNTSCKIISMKEYKKAA